MPLRTPLEKRDRALIAFAILTGARDGALASFRLKHADLAAQIVSQDAREVKTKGRKTFSTTFFLVGPEPLAIVADYLRFLKDELSFGPGDPLFPSTRVGHGIDRAYEAQGLSRRSWTTAAPIRSIFRAAFAAVDLPYSNPHSFRNTLVRLGQRLRLTPEEWKAWSQNLGHESESTTFVGYSHVPLHRQAEIMRALARPRRAALPDNLDIAAQEAFVNSAKPRSKMPSEASAEADCPSALCLFVAKRIGFRPTLRWRYSDLKRRLADHYSGKSPHRSK